MINKGDKFEKKNGQTLSHLWIRLCNASQQGLQVKALNSSVFH